MAKKSTKKTTRKTAAKRKTTKKKPMQFADGKDHSPAPGSKEAKIAELRELEKAVGLTKFNPFQTDNEDEFDEKIAEMNMTDLQSLAVTAGVFPSGTRPILKNKLKKAFLTTTKVGNMSSPLKPVIDPNSEAAKRIRKISNM